MIVEKTRQAKWQKKMKDSNKCVECAKPTKGKVRCELCAEMQRIRQKKNYRAKKLSLSVLTQH